MDFKIVEFEGRHQSRVIDLWKQIFKGDPPWNEPKLIIKRKLVCQPELFLVGELNGKVVATVLGGYDGFRGWIYHLAVAPTCQRTGLASVIMETIQNKLKSMGCIKINIQVRAGNSDIVNFYKSLGYKIEDHISLGKCLHS